MPQFNYRAKDRKGAPIEGVMEAESHSAATGRLQAMGYFPLAIDELKKKRSPSGLNFLRRPRVGDLATMFRQMADLVGSGIPLVRSLSVVAEQVPNEQLRQILTQINQDVSSGDSMAQAMAKHPKVFPKLHCAMVRAGEMGGMLSDVLERLASFAEAEDELRSKIKSAMAYPMVMIVAGSVAIVVLVTVVIPRILRIFANLDQALPPITQLLISIIDFVHGYWWALLGGAAALGFGLWNLARTEDGRLWIDRMLLRVPVLGTVIAKREVAKFARTLGALIRNGVTILTALEIVGEVMTNRVIAHEVKEIPPNITQGEGMSKTLKDSKIFPPVVINMIAIGEETGHLDHALLRIADSYERQVERSVKTLTDLIEPLIIVVMAGVVGFLVIALLLPIFSIDVAGR